MTILKALKQKYCIGFCTFQKYVVRFTDSNPTIYLHAKIAEKTANTVEINLPIYASTKCNSIKTVFAYLAVYGA